VIALMLMNVPEILRAMLVLLTLIAIPPASLTLYALMKQAAQGEHIDIGLARQVLGDLLLPSYRSFAPLMGFLGFLLWLINLAGEANLFIISVLLQVGLLLLLSSANYWGPLLIDSPGLSAPAVLLEAGRWLWRYPGRTLLLSGSVLLALILGAISVGGLVLAVPVIISLLQTQMVLAIMKDSRRRSTQPKGKASAWDS
jgi:hypothetical protein